MTQTILPPPERADESFSLPRQAVSSIATCLICRTEGEHLTVGQWAPLPDQPYTDAYAMMCLSCELAWLLERTGEDRFIRRSETAYEALVRIHHRQDAAREAERFSWGELLREVPQLPRALARALPGLLLRVLKPVVFYGVMFADVKLVVDATMPWAGPKGSYVIVSGLFFAGLLWAIANEQRLDRAWKAWKGEKEVA